MGRIAESLSHQPQRILNTDATNKAEEVDAARQEVAPTSWPTASLPAP